MDAAGGLGVGHALDAMHAGFELELGEGAATFDLGDDFLVAAHRALAGGDDLDLPALLGGEAFVHAEQIAGKQGGLVAARAGADFDDDVAIVHRVLGQQRDLELLFQRGASLLQRRLLRRRHLTHLRVGLGVVEHRVESVDLRDDVAICLHDVDDRTELGEFARQPHIGLRRDLCRQLALDRLVAGH